MPQIAREQGGSISAELDGATCGLEGKVAFKTTHQMKVGGVFDQKLGGGAGVGHQHHLPDLGVAHPVQAVLIRHQAAAKFDGHRTIKGGVEVGRVMQIRMADVGQPRGKAANLMARGLLRRGLCRRWILARDL